MLRKLKNMSDQESIDANEILTNLLNSFRRGAEKELGFLRHPLQNNQCVDGSVPSIRAYGLNMNALKCCVQAFFDCTLYYIKVMGPCTNEGTIEPNNRNAIFLQVNWKFESFYLPKILFDVLSKQHRLVFDFFNFKVMQWIRDYLGLRMRDTLDVFRRIAINFCRSAWRRTFI